MILTDGWKKDVAKLVRRADLAHVSEIDEVGGFYALDQEAIVAVIAEYGENSLAMTRTEVEYHVVMQLQNYGSSWLKLQALVDSICSRLGIVIA